MLHSVNLSDYMIRNPLTITPKDDLSVAVKLILENKVSGLCVANEKNVLLGVLSEIDCLNAGLAQSNTKIMLGTTVVSDYIITEPVKICPDEDLYQAVNSIIRHRVSGLCVVDPDDVLVGVLSEMDCLRAVLSAIYNDQREADKVFMHMTENVEHCDSDSALEVVARDMLEKGRRRRPVTREGRLVGQITCRQILSAISKNGWDKSIVEEHMSASVEDCQLQDDIVTIANNMLKKGRRRRPVVDDGELVGQITCRQLLRVVSEFNRNQVAANFDPLYRDLL